MFYDSDIIVIDGVITQFGIAREIYHWFKKYSQVRLATLEERKVYFDRPYK
jgi:hypothetical protein